MINILVGDDGANALDGTSAADLIYGFNPDGPQSQVGKIAAARVAKGLDQPLFAGAPDGDLHRLFIAEKGGLIKILNLDTGKVLATPFLDVSAQISTTGERGLLGFAFDPDFDQNGYVYVNLINTSGDTEIRRYEVSANNPNKLAAASATTIITIDQPGFANHKAGWIGFGPDGNLYIPLGDGGGGGDPNNNAQDLDSLLGKILRLDVHGDDFPGDDGRNYAIPADNPFVGAAGLDEIWALGLRNPYRDSFDRATGTFFIADVGQNSFEEINLGEIGANYGWDKFEGPAVFEPGTPTGGTATAPIHYYDHNVGNVVIGGYAYRGSSDGLQGQYFFADLGAGKLFTLRFDGSSWVRTNRAADIKTNVGSLDGISSFGEDGAGNLYAVDIVDGEVFRLTPSAASSDTADMLRGLDGDDMIYGGAGDDHLNGGLGADYLNGGAGFDYARYDDAAAGVQASLANPAGNTGEAVGDVYALIEGLVGSAFNDILIGNTVANGVNASTTNDVLMGGLGDDELYGLKGNDRLVGGPGEDTLNGARGIDTADYATSADAVSIRLKQAGPQSGGDAEGDRLASIENVIGSDFDDLLVGNARPNRLTGLDGNDVLVGGKGRDVLAGGADADRFDFNGIRQSTANKKRDVISDFSRAEGDQIDLSTIDANAKVPGNQAFKFIGKQDFHGKAGELHYQKVKAGALVEADVNGDGDADFAILVKLSLLKGGDFIL